MTHLASKEGVFAEPAGATALAGLYKLQQTKPFDADASVVVLITGNGLKDINSVNKTVLEKVLSVSKEDATALSQETESIAHFLTQLQERSEQHE
jgi:threonine synthase